MARGTSVAPHTAEVLQKRACSLCARRKVKCDKSEPCSNCVTAQVQCRYDVPVSPRPRKRAANEELIKRLTQYEDLMRMHNIDFSHYSNVWVPSGLEAKNDGASTETATSLASSSACPFTGSEATSPSCTESTLQRSLWPDLKSQLQFPPIQVFRHREDPLLDPTPPLHEIMASHQPGHHRLHPEPRHIYRLWQTYIDRVDPLIKFVHVPTLQQRILDACWDPSNVPEPLAATMFAIYTLAVTSMSADDCQATFGEMRSTLMIRYRIGAIKALIAADLFVTRDFEVLQALLLFLFADPESPFALTFVSVAVKLAQVLGLQRESTDPKMPFFDKEMRVRLWWQLRSLEVRTNATALILSRAARAEFGDIRLPLNVNDVDLHPDMTEPPAEHKGPTEMLYALMKFEPAYWIRSSPLGAKLFEVIYKGPVKGKTSMAVEDEAVREMGQIFRNKYLDALDDSIPLHLLARQMGKRAGAWLRFKIHHPRGRASTNGGDIYMPQEELDLLFDTAIDALEIPRVCEKMQYAPHLAMHMSARFEVDAFIYIVSELKRRLSGEQVDRAWSLVERLCNDNSRITDDIEDTFYLALGDLVLEAWDVRSRELLDKNGSLDHMTPQYISRLREKRTGNQNEVALQGSSPFPYLDTLESLHPMGFYDQDGSYWGSLMQM